MCGSVWEAAMEPTPPTVVRAGSRVSARGLPAKYIIIVLLTSRRGLPNNFTHCLLSSAGPSR